MRIVKEGALYGSQSRNEQKKTGMIRRFVSVCLVFLALITAIPAISYAEDYYDVMDQFDSRIQKPKKSSVLDEAEVYYVRSKYGNCIYVYSRPNKDSRHIGKVDERSEVLVYAIENGFALGMVKGTEYGGWMRKELLSTKRPSPDPGPKPPDLWPTLPSGMYRPKRNEYLPAYETMYVKSKYGNFIYMYYDPTEQPLRVYDKIMEGTKCTLIARKGSMYFVRTEYGQRGWVSVSRLSYDPPG